MVARILLLFILDCALVCRAEAINDGDASQTRDQRAFNVAITGPGPLGLAYGDPIVLTVKVAPVRDFERSDLSVRPLGDLAAIYDVSKEEDVATCVADGSSRAVTNVTFVATCELQPITRRRFWRPATWFLPPGVQRLALGIPVVGDDGKAVIFYEEVPLTFKAPLDAIFIGGLTGALLLAIFTSVRGRAQAPITEIRIDSWAALWAAMGALGAWGVGLAPRIWRLFLQTVMGGICALILILLAQSTEGLNPPISVKIQDFWGGVVVGLFSIPLSRWIWTQVQPKVP